MVFISSGRVERKSASRSFKKDLNFKGVTHKWSKNEVIQINVWATLRGTRKKTIFNCCIWKRIDHLMKSCWKCNRKTICEIIVIIKVEENEGWVPSWMMIEFVVDSAAKFGITKGTVSIAICHCYSSGHVQVVSNRERRKELASLWGGRSRLNRDGEKVERSKSLWVLH